MRIVRLALPLGLLAGLVFSPALHAENLAADVPADAIFFAQWAGTDALGPAYDASHTKGLLNAFQLQKLLQSRLAQHQAEETDAQKKANEQAVADVLTAAVKAPTALYVGPMDFSDPDKPSLKIAVFSKIGHDAADNFAKQFHADPPKAGDPPVVAVAVNDFLLLTVGSDMDIDKRLAAPVAGDLASTDSYKNTTAKVMEGNTVQPAALAYLNGQSALHTLDDAIAAKAPPQRSRNWPRVEAALNLDALQAFAVAGNFDGPDWTTRAFIALAENRAGLAAFLDSPALPASALALIPSSATWASVSRFDAPRLLDDARNAMGNISGGGKKQFDFGLQQFFAFTGVDLQHDLFPSLGDAYIFYGTPDAAGHSLKNLTMVSPLKNPAKAETSLNTLESFINAMAGQRDPNTKINFKTEPLPAPNDKVTLHFLTLNTLAPSWTVANGNLYFSMTKEGLTQAIVDAAKHTSLPDNPSYTAARKQVAQDAVSSLAFMNVPALAPELYDLLQQAFTKHQADHPKELGDYQLPPLSALLPQLSPSILTAWTDAAGWHMQAHGDAPSAGLIAPQSLIVSEAIKKEQAAERSAPAAPPAAPLP